MSASRRDFRGRRHLNTIYVTSENAWLCKDGANIVIEVDPAQWAKLRARLLEEIDAEKDSLRFYRLGADGKRRVEHVGAKPALDLDGPLLF